MNAYQLGFRSGTFDRVICGFMGWYDCFDFSKSKFTRPDLKTREILRVLKGGGQFIVCSWEKQEDVSWMENSILKHYPEILVDQEYLDQRPIGMAYEKAESYEHILHEAGFHDIQATKEEAAFISTDEEEWWRQMRQVGWADLLDNIERKGHDQLRKLKQTIFRELQQYKHAHGILFSKTVFFVSGVK